MPSTTTRAGLPYPLGTDPISDGDDAMKNLASRLDGSTGNVASVPYAMASGTVIPAAPTAPPAGSSVAITFPTGRFSQVPNIFATTQGSLTSPSWAMQASSTTTGFTLFRWQQAGAAASLGVAWLAIQMTAAASNG